MLERKVTVNAGEKEIKDAFLKALAGDGRYDHETRLVFADWLEEKGLDEEAVGQRRWTPAWQRAEDWLRAFAVTATEGKTPVTLEEIVEAGWDYVRQGEQTQVSVGMGFGATNALVEPEEVEAFWQNWETYTR